MYDSDDIGFLSAEETSLTRFACPDCGGSLAEVGLDSVTYYRCHVGHQFSPKVLEAAQRAEAERRLWAALAALEEHAVMARRLADGDHTDQDYRRCATESSETARWLYDRLQNRGPMRPA